MEHQSATHRGTRSADYHLLSSAGLSFRCPFPAPFFYVFPSLALFSSCSLPVDPSSFLYFSANGISSDVTTPCATTLSSTLFSHSSTHPRRLLPACFRDNTKKRGSSFAAPRVAPNALRSSVRHISQFCSVHPSPLPQALRTPAASGVVHPICSEINRAC